MDSYIRISTINDFLYSPKSLYLHGIYESLSQDVYHETPQTVGKMHHECIDKGTYSTAKRFIQGMSVYSEKYNLGGKIDIYDCEKKMLIERKTRIKDGRIHTGQRYQLYAQMYAMREMGYPVEHLRIHSLEDNKRYIVPLPSFQEETNFISTLWAMRTYDFTKDAESCQQEHQCNISIYRHLNY